MSSHEIVIAFIVALFLLACAILIIQGKAEAKREKRRRSRKAWTSGHMRKVAEAKKKAAANRK